MSETTTSPVTLTKDPVDVLVKSTARAAIKNLPEHTFQTGSKGRNASKKVTVTDETGKKRKAVVTVTVVFSDTTKRAQERAAKAAGEAPAS